MVAKKAGRSSPPKPKPTGQTSSTTGKPGSGVPKATRPSSQRKTSPGMNISKLGRF